MRRLFSPVSIVLTAILTGLLGSSCNMQSGEDSSFVTLESGSWVYGDTLKFTLHGDTLCPRGHLEVALRHTNDYPYSNIWLEVTSHDISGRTYTDTVNIDLCDMFGRWYGNGFGDSYQVVGKVSTPIVLDTTACVGVRHIMRVDTLSGIDQAGVRFIPDPPH